MTVNTNSSEMAQLIGVQTLRINQLENENATLKEQIEQAKADADTAAFAKENAELAKAVVAERNGVVADVTG